MIFAFLYPIIYELQQNNFSTSTNQALRDLLKEIYWNLDCSPLSYYLHLWCDILKDRWTVRSLEI